VPKLTHVLVLGAILALPHPPDGGRHQAAGVRSQAREEKIRVLDDSTRLPIEGVEVVNTRSGWSGRTSSEGVVAVPVDTSGLFLSIRRIGYYALTVHLAHAPSDTSTKTLTLVALTPSLPPVLTLGSTRSGRRGPADTVHALELNGFYDRRVSTAAPGSAFVTSERLAKLSRITDVRYLTGRGICTANLYLNGARFSQGMSVARVVQPGQVLGIELYSHVAEIPAAYNRTLPSGMLSPCATLIWTK
jgi:hypothetical protein